MKLARRTFIHLAAGAAALPSTACRAWAQDYPSRPVRMLVGFAAGGPADVYARLISQWLTERLGQSFVVENRTGAGTNIATEAVVRAPPDGNTLLLVSAANAINKTLYPTLGFDFIQDITPIAGLGTEPNVLLLNPSVPAKTVPEFIAYSKAHPGKIAMASGGNGAPSHVSGELFKMMAGVSMVHVPYRGAAPALTDLLAGQVQVYFGPLVTAVDHIKTGRLHALAVTSSKRSDILPDIPTVAEFVPGYEAIQLYGIGAPKHTPAEIVDKLNKEINAALADPKIKERFAQLGTTALPGSAADFGRFVAQETEKWAEVVKFSGARPD
ncbi:MAG TPA: tripartite tricarboxylate transporter substrate binding protein [Xanthobacteraceae bacterium]